MLTLLGLGFVLGMRHALEADHAAAVASLALKNRSMSQTVRQGLAWGIGHTLTLLFFSSLVLLLGLVIPEQFAEALEFAVGLMLLGLGINVLRKMSREHIHFHVHEHQNEPPHFHAHKHDPQDLHETAPSHDHSHPNDFPYRALIVGLMHGMAGSAALIVLTLQTVISPAEAIAYILLFGLGSTLGMGIFSLVMAIPLWYSARSLSWWHNSIQVCVGISTITLGLFVLYNHSDWFLG
jgi:ABC-type nickel/cobalt efflux system permease component RcnA